MMRRCKFFDEIGRDAIAVHRNSFFSAVVTQCRMLRLSDRWRKRARHAPTRPRRRAKSRLARLEAAQCVRGWQMRGIRDKKRHDYRSRFSLTSWRYVGETAMWRPPDTVFRAEGSGRAPCGEENSRNVTLKSVQFGAFSQAGVTVLKLEVCLSVEVRKSYQKFKK